MVKFPPAPAQRTPQTGLLDEYRNQEGEIPAGPRIQKVEFQLALAQSLPPPPNRFT